MPPVNRPTDKTTRDELLPTRSGIRTEKERNNQMVRGKLHIKGILAWQAIVGYPESHL